MVSPTSLTSQRFKGTVVNRTHHSTNGGSLEMTLTIPLTELPRHIQCVFSVDGVNLLSVEPSHKPEENQSSKSRSRLF